MEDVGCLGESTNKLFTWMLVCDGIGGNPGGMDAAKTTAIFLQKYLRKYLKRKNQLNGTAFIETGIEYVKNEMIRLVKNEPNKSAMGCTLCLCIFYCGDAYVYWSGDSRFYLFRENKCMWDVIPHNWSFDLYRKGILSLNEARLSESTYLTGSINPGTPTIRIDYRKLSLRINDRLLLCTDGVWSLFEHPDLTRAITEYPFSKTSIMMSAYLKMYSNDNYFGYLVNCYRNE